MSGFSKELIESAAKPSVESFGVHTQAQLPTPEQTGAALPASPAIDQETVQPVESKEWILLTGDQITGPVVPVTYPVRKDGQPNVYIYRKTAESNIDNRRDLEPVYSLTTDSQPEPITLQAVGNLTEGQVKALAAVVEQVPAGHKMAPAEVAKKKPHLMAMVPLSIEGKLMPLTSQYRGEVRHNYAKELNRRIEKGELPDEEHIALALYIIPDAETGTNQLGMGLGVSGALLHYRHNRQMDPTQAILSTMPLTDTVTGNQLEELFSRTVSEARVQYKSIMQAEITADTKHLKDGYQMLHLLNGKNIPGVKYAPEDFKGKLEYPDPKFLNVAQSLINYRYLLNQGLEAEAADLARVTLKLIFDYNQNGKDEAATLAQIPEETTKRLIDASILYPQRAKQLGTDHTGGLGEDAFAALSQFA